MKSKVAVVNSENRDVALMNSAVANSNTLKLLIITDQVGSSGAVTSHAGAQTAEHFKAISNFVADQAIANGGDTYIIKNIGDSLMIKFECMPKSLPSLLGGLLEEMNRLHNKTVQGAKVTLRALIIPLICADKDYISGEDIPVGYDKKWAVVLPQARSTKYTSWLGGDLFGPKVNLAFRAAHIDTKVPALIIEETVAEEVAKLHKAIDLKDAFSVDSLLIGRSMPFSPFRGLENLFEFNVPNENEGWRGHLFLRSVKLQSATARDKARNNELGPLELEQEKFKVFTRFIWLDAPDKDDVAGWHDALEEFQGNAKYFRNLSTVQQEVRIERVEKPSGKRTSSKIISYGGHDFFPRNPSDTGIHTGLIGVFAGPFERTYDALREKIFNRRASIGIRNTKFKYPITTLVYPHAEVPHHFWEESSAAWHLLLFWRWTPHHRTNGSDECEILSDMIRRNYAVWNLQQRRVGMVVGGEWDGYATFVAGNELGGASPAPADWENFVLSLAKPMGEQHVEALAAYLCERPAISDTLDIPAAQKSSL